MCKVERFAEPTPLLKAARPIYFYVTDNDCFICVSHRKDRDGYSRIDRGGREWQMHRYIFSITKCEIPKGMVVRHKCDNPSCNNPEHLELGTQGDNINDMKLRNRTCRIPRRLSDVEKEKIKTSNKTNAQLANEFKVSNSTIVMVKRKHRQNLQRRMVKDKSSIPSSNKNRGSEKRSKNELASND